MEIGQKQAVVEQSLVLEFWFFVIEIEKGTSFQKIRTLRLISFDTFLKILRYYLELLALRVRLAFRIEHNVSFNEETALTHDFISGKALDPANDSLLVFGDDDGVLHAEAFVDQGLFDYEHHDVPLLLRGEDTASTIKQGVPSQIKELLEESVLFDLVNALCL